MSGSFGYFRCLHISETLHYCFHIRFVKVSSEHQLFWKSCVLCQDLAKCSLLKDHRALHVQPLLLASQGKASVGFVLGLNTANVECCPSAYSAGVFFHIYNVLPVTAVTSCPSSPRRTHVRTLLPTPWANQLQTVTVLLPLTVSLFYYKDSVV